MANVKDWFLDKIGITDDNLEDEYEEEEAEIAFDDGTNVRSFDRARRGLSQRTASTPTFTPSVSSAAKTVIYHPIGYDDARNIVDNFKSRKPVIVNIVELAESDVNMAQRILDYMDGAVYALGGTLTRVEFGIYFMAPAGHDVVSNATPKEGL